MKYLVYVGMLLFFVTGCNKKSQAEKDQAVIDAYLKEHPEIVAKRHSSGLYYQIIEPGTGGHPNLYSGVKVKYKGTLANGEVFDETTGNETTNFYLYEVIKAWQIGIPLMQKGGKEILIVPSDLGYGGRDIKRTVTDTVTGEKTEVVVIPAHSVLIFDVELVDF